MGRRVPVFQHAEIYTKHMRSERKNKADGNKTQITKELVHPPNMGRTDNRSKWSIDFNQTHLNTGKASSNKKGEKKDNEVNGGVPKEVDTVLSSSQSQTSSIGIGEFSMKAAKQGNAATFSWAVKFQLFKNVKFLQGPDASLDFSMNESTICGFMRSQCGVSESDASQWWEEHRTSLRNHLTES
jgi:transcriptional regulator NrdR family protein